MPKGADSEGLRKMWEYAAALPEQLRVGFRAGKAVASQVDRAAAVVVAGMGGSAISADLLAPILESETDVPLRAVRGPELPRWAGAGSLAALVSYSGDTWETLAAYDEAGRRGMARVAVSAGGALKERATRDRVPFVAVPPGPPPRAAVGYLLGALLGATDGFFATSNEPRLARCAERLEARRPRLAARSGGAARLAAAIGSRVPAIYATALFAGLARRWMTQVEENAKRLADFQVAPELFHNAIVGWDAISPVEARRRAILFLRCAPESGGAAERFAYLGRLVRRKGVLARDVPIEGDDLLDTLLTGVAWGDAVSLFLAEAAGVDPLPIEAIARMKRTLGPG
jgi:glucose/mannose-6-phosphate isomerase